MPFVKGNELASRIRSIMPAQRILMMTGFAHRIEPDNPVNAVVNKPLNLDRLQSIMSQVLSDDSGSFEETLFAELEHN